MSESTLAEMLWRIKKLRHEETRRESEVYLELVTLRESVDNLSLLLETYFGPPLKPAGMQPSKEIHAHTEAFGGIQKDQTLYFREQNDEKHIAMIWPWQDGKRATLKIAQGAQNPL